MEELTRPVMTKKAAMVINEMHYRFKCKTRSESILKCYTEMHRFRANCIDLKRSLQNACKELDITRDGLKDAINDSRTYYKFSNYCVYLLIASIAVNAFLFVGWVL